MPAARKLVLHYIACIWGNNSLGVCGCFHGMVFLGDFGPIAAEQASKFVSKSLLLEYYAEVRNLCP